MDDALAQYAYLWTTAKRDWVLLADEESRKEKDFIPYNIKTWRFLDIPDATTRADVVAHMLAAGVPQVTDEDVFGK
jgi:hypothetical protein